MRTIEKILIIIIASIYISITLLFIAFFIYALCLEDTTEAKKQEFSKYYNGKDEVVLIRYDTLYFENYSIDLNDLIEKENPDGVIVKKDRMLFTTSKKNSKSNYSLNIYESDLTGEEINLLFTKNEYKKEPSVYANGNLFYIEHSSKQIDIYNVITGEYKNIASGKDVSLEDYIIEEESIFDYSVIENESSEQHGLFKIKNTATNQEKIIDDNFLFKTEYIESLNMFGYGPFRVDISNGHILLTYSIGSGDGWNESYLIFEYNFEEDTLEYKCLVFPDERIAVEIIYIG